MNYDVQDIETDGEVHAPIQKHRENEIWFSKINRDDNELLHIPTGLNINESAREDTVTSKCCISAQKVQSETNSYLKTHAELPTATTRITNTEDHEHKGDYSFITEEILDSLSIRKGTRRDRLQKYYELSMALYTSLLLCLGDERLFAARRILLDNDIDCLENLGKLIISGSKAEGFDMKSSDLDIMNVESMAYEIGTTLIKNGYLFDSLNFSVKPGYTMIKEVKGWKISKTVSSHNYRATILKEISENSMFQTSQHGPSILMSPFQQNLDTVVCLRSKRWPQVATEWKARDRNFKWPSKKLVQKIFQSGCHIVPKGISMTSSDVEKEWRLSFSLAENLLVRSFNHTQLLTYGALKIILAEVLKKTDEIKDCLCSYFLKTAVFWVSEENDYSIWIPRNIFYCLHLCIQRLLKWTSESICPNYFVPTNNMFDGKLCNITRKVLYDFLCKFNGNLKDLFFQCPSLSNCKEYPNELRTRNLNLSKSLTDETINFYCVDYMIKIKGYLLRRLEKCDNNSERRMLIKKLLKMNVPKRLLRISYQYLCYYILPDLRERSNKCIYNFNKFFVKFIFRGDSVDITTSMLHLANWLYNGRRYSDCLKVLDFVLEVIKAALYVSIPKIYICKEQDERQAICRTLNVMQQAKYYLVTPFLIPSESKLLPEELNILTTFQINNAQAFIGFHTETYCHFLRFLCYHRQGEVEKRRVALKHLGNIKFTDKDITSTLYENLKRILQNICLFVVQCNRNVVDINDIVKPCHLISLPDSFLEKTGFNEKILQFNINYRTKIR